MFNYQELYTTPSQRLGTRHWVHASGMCELCRNPTGISFDTARNVLGLTQLTLLTVASNEFPRAVYARDAYGQTLAVHAPDMQGQNAWEHAMNAGLVTMAFSPGKVLAGIHAYATLVYQQLPAVLDTTKPLTVFGHGVGGAVALLVARMAKAATGVATAHMMIQPAAFCTEAAFENLSVNSAAYSDLRDPWCFAPPPGVMDLGPGSQGTLEPLFYPATHYSMVGTRRERTRSLDPLVRNGHPWAWTNLGPLGPHKTLWLSFLRDHHYPGLIWSTQPVWSQTMVLPWLGILRDSYHYLIQRDAA